MKTEASDISKKFKAAIAVALISLAALPISGRAYYQPHFSTAGFFGVEGSGREAYSMNPAWRFHKGAALGAEQTNFNDGDWSEVSLPHGIELLPAEASGCVNYQGEVWYRKHFHADAGWKGQRLVLYFEAIMGKSKVWVNGKLVAEHFGGYLPVIADISDALNFGGENIIAVWADNSDDPAYPPGKPQRNLDFTYFGGIYRDCWLVKTNNVFITDANEEDVKAGGGLFVSYGKVAEALTEMRVSAALRNKTDKAFKGKLRLSLQDKAGKTVWQDANSLHIPAGGRAEVSSLAKLKGVRLWSPDAPYLYRLYVYAYDNRGKLIDGYYIRVGLRSIEFKGEEGFWLNGKPYPEPLIGANRHQDFAVIGNALPNSLHWRDAKKLRDAGMRVIRNAHYPQDPAFMDACDELGLFVIENTPGWQFWNEAPSFAERVYSDIRNIVRRDRNRPSVWLYEPILNETNYPEDFAKTVRAIVHEEYPYPYCYAASDRTAKGSSCYDVQFAHPEDAYPGGVGAEKPEAGKTYFTREWGDNVDDWGAHNSPSRASRAWGEYPMLVQALGYADTKYTFPDLDAFYRAPRQYVGGCIWHSFDHQRGYHPDPFYGGIMDNFRQPKYSYYMFASQRPNKKAPDLIAGSGPMVYIANAMTPFSPADITVFSNCDSVRLTYGKGGKTFTHIRPKSGYGIGMPSPVITFKDVFHEGDDEKFFKTLKGEDVYLLAEGYVDGKLAATHKVTPGRRPVGIKLTVDNEGTALRADGSDIVTVVASVVDQYGTVKRLNNEHIVFSVEGEGRIVGDEATFTNPAAVSWGTAPVLIQATTKPGKIVVRARVVWEGISTPAEGTIEINSIKAEYPMIADDAEVKRISGN